MRCISVKNSVAPRTGKSSSVAARNIVKFVETQTLDENIVNYKDSK